MPKVLNKRKDVIPPGAIYVGRPSKWGNPFKIGDLMIGIPMSREVVILRYKAMVLATLLKNPHYLDELKGKDLICWCAPLPCHADVLLELANE